MKKNKIIIAAAAIGFMSNGGMILSPALSGIIKHFSAYPETLVEMLITIPALMMIPSSIISSWLNRKFSCRKIFIVCLALLLISGLLPFFVDYFPVVLATRVVVGIAIGAMTPLATSMIANNFEGAERNRAMGVYTASEGFGGATMLLFCGLVVDTGWNYCFLVYAAVIIQLLLVLICCPKKDTFIEEISENRRDGKLINPTIVGVMVVFFIYMTFLNVFAINNSLLIEESGIGNGALAGVTGAMFQVSCFICGLLYSRVTGLFRNLTFGFGIAMSAIGMIIVLLSGSPAGVIIGAMFGGFGMSTTLATGNLMTASSVAPTMSAMAIAVGAAAYQLAQFMTSFIVHPIAAHIFGEGAVRGRYIVSSYVLAGLAFIVLTVMGVNGKRRSCRNY